MEKINLEEVKEYIFKKHDEVRQVYGGYLPYRYHLELALAISDKYIWMIPEKDRDLVRGAVVAHDSLEDCHITYNDLKSRFSTELADIVYAVTNEKGKTRKERANAKYYEGIRKTKYATFVKLCDRMANVLYSCMFGSQQFEMYKKENSDFEQELWINGIDEVFMFRDLRQLFKTRCFGFEVNEVPTT